MLAGVRAALVVAVLLFLAPSAVACSWSYPEAAGVVWTQSGLFWRAREDLRHGEPSDSTVIASLAPFGGFLAAPNGTVVYHTHGVGGVGGDCSVPYHVVERWTPEGNENVTDLMPGFPLAIHWPTERALFAIPGGAAIRDLSTDRRTAEMMIGTPTAVVTYIGSDMSTSVRRAAWSPLGDKLALATDDGVWMFDDQGAYLYDAYATFSVQNAIPAFSHDGGTLVVAWAPSDGFTEVRLLDLTDPSEIRFSGGHRDTRTLHALAVSPAGTIALGLHEHPLYGGAPWGSGSIAYFRSDLTHAGNITWEGEEIGDSLSWSPDGEGLVLVVGRDIVRVDPDEATAAPDATILIKRERLLPVPGAWMLAGLIGLVVAAALRDRSQ